VKMKTMRRVLLFLIGMASVTSALGTWSAWAEASDGPKIAGHCGAVQRRPYKSAPDLSGRGFACPVRANGAVLSG